MSETGSTDDLTRTETATAEPLAEKLPPAPLIAPVPPGNTVIETPCSGVFVDASVTIPVIVLFCAAAIIAETKKNVVRKKFLNFIANSLNESKTNFFCG